MPSALYRRGESVCYGKHGGAYIVVNVCGSKDGWRYDLASANGFMKAVRENELRPESGDRRYMDRPEEENDEPWLTKRW